MLQRNLILVVSTIFILSSLTSDCEGATGDLPKEKIDELEESHLKNIVGFVPLYQGDSVSEFLKISERCLNHSCGPQCSVEPCNRFVLADLKLAYDIVKAFKTKLDSQYENIILMVMTATAICLSLYLWFVGHFSVRATWIYSVFYPNEDFQDPCQGIPMRLYTEMEFETLFNNEPRLKKIQKEEKNKIKNKKIIVDKSVQAFFQARPYLRKLENDPSVLADLMALKDKKEEDDDSSSLTDEEHYTDERQVAEDAMHKFFEEKEQEEQRRDREVGVIQGVAEEGEMKTREEEEKETLLKNVFLHDHERLKHVNEDPTRLALGMHHPHAPVHARHSLPDAHRRHSLAEPGIPRAHADHYRRKQSDNTLFRSHQDPNLHEDPEDPDK